MDKKLLMQTAAVLLMGFSVGAALGFYFVGEYIESYTNECVEVLTQCQDEYHKIAPMSQQGFLNPINFTVVGVNATTNK